MGNLAKMLSLYNLPYHENVEFLFIYRAINDHIYIDKENKTTKI